MMQRCTRWTASALAVLALLAPVACGDDDDVGTPTEPGDPVTAADLAGSYELVSFTQGGFTLTPPAATGALMLTLTRYDVEIMINVPGQETEIMDAGTYSVESGTWVQESDDPDFPQAVGTFEFDGTTLEVDVTIQGARILNVWRRTSG